MTKTCAELQTELDNATDTFTRHAITLILANRAVRLEAELQAALEMQDLNYKDFVGSVEFDTHSNTLCGKVKFIKGLITYESPDGTFQELVEAFHESIDEYLEDCAEMHLTTATKLQGLT